MNIQIDAPPEPERPKRRPPPDFTSGAFRIRLAMLFAALLVVLVLMQEARKPENWEWMGFPDKVADTNTAPADLFDEDASPAPHTGQTSEPQVPSVAPTRIDQLVESDSRAFPAQAKLFWQQLLGRVGQARRVQLFHLLRHARTGKPLPTQDAPAADLLRFVDQQRLRFETQLLDSISFLDQSNRKSQLNQQLFDAKSMWRDTIFPALQAVVEGEELTLNQLAGIRRLQSVFDEYAFRQVEDSTALNRSVEGPASLRLWERALAMTQPGDRVSPIQLTGQPEAYRGHLVTVTGWVRRIDHQSFPQNELGISKVHVLWVRPEDSNQVPICVYAQQIPEGFPIEKIATNKLNEKIEVQGAFYKIRSYLSQEKKVLECPLIFAKSFRQISADRDESANDAWWPPIWAITLFLVGMPLAATMIAVWVYRNTQSRKLTPSEKMLESIHTSLEGLQDDDRIQSDLERVQELN